MSAEASLGGFPRFEAAMPVLCTARVPWRPFTRSFAGKTHTVGTGGLALVLPQALEAETPVSVRLWQGDPLEGRIVWVGSGFRTDVGSVIFPHGMAFAQPVESTLVEHWLSLAKRRPPDRVAARFGVQFTGAGVTRRGTCLNISRGGMYIATPDLVPPTTPLVIQFSLPELERRDDLMVQARVVWVRAEDGGPGAERGMGVQFVDLEIADATAIGAAVDRLRNREMSAVAATG